MTPTVSRSRGRFYGWGGAGRLIPTPPPGWAFAPTLDSLVSLRASYEFRLTLEPSGFLLPTFKPDHAAIERMRLQHLYVAPPPDITSVNRMQLFETDAAFHEMCAEASGNAFFAQAIQSQNRLRRLLEFGS